MSNNDYSNLINYLQRRTASVEETRAAEAITTLQQQLAEANSEVERLNKWADDFTDRHLKERQTGDALVKELQKTIAAQRGEIAALKDLVGALQIPPSCQAGVHENCFFVKCCKDRLKALTEGGE